MWRLYTGTSMFILSINRRCRMEQKSTPRLKCSRLANRSKAGAHTTGLKRYGWNMLWRDLPQEIFMSRENRPSLIGSITRKKIFNCNNTNCMWLISSILQWLFSISLGYILSPFSGACFNINLFPIFQPQSFSMFLAFLLNNKFLRFCTDGLQM